MMSIEYILALADEAGEVAKEAGEEPYVYQVEETVGAPFPFPNLGSYRPLGWEMGEYHTVDKTGWGAEDEPALTHRQLVALIESVREERPNTGWAIIEEGQFQLVVAQFRQKYRNG